MQGDVTDGGLGPVDPEIERAMRAVMDPEIGLDVVSLGLVYRAWREDRVAHVVMTMTTPACPLHEMITEDVTSAVSTMVRGIDEVDVQLVFEPRWSPARMSEEAKSQLGWDR
jgi:metal-sulfur cluster biosynthetic enzyme